MQTHQTTWLADGPSEIVPALARIGVGAYRHLYMHVPADAQSSDPDFDGLVVVNDEQFHGCFDWPHHSSITEAIVAAEHYADVLKGVGERYPQARIGVYGLPNARMWVWNNAGAVVHWGDAEPEQMDACRAWYLDALEPLCPVVDVVIVSCYEDCGTAALAPHRAVWRTRIELARALRDHWAASNAGADPVDVAAFVSPCCFAGATQKLTPKDAWLARTVECVCEAAPDKIICWGAWDYWTGVAASTPSSPQQSPTIVYARSLMASVLASMDVRAIPQHDDHKAWASLHPLLRRACASAVFTRLEAAVFESDRLHQSTEGWIPAAPNEAAA